MNEIPQHKSVKNTPQVTSFISEGNPNAQQVPSDKEAAKVVTQAIKDDQALAPVADDIHVTVKDGAITLNGTVETTQQLNLATNTATAVGEVDVIDNKIKIVDKK